MIGQSDKRFKELLACPDVVSEALAETVRVTKALELHLDTDMRRDRFMYGEFERQSREITYLKVSLWALALLTALNFVLGVK